MIEVDDKAARAKLAKIIAGLRELSKSEAKKVMRKATRAGAKVMQPAVKSLAPVASGALRKAIKVRSIPRSRRWVGATVRVGNQVGDNLHSGDQWYGGPIELGWKTGKRGSTNRKQIEGRHFIKQGFEQSKQQALAESISVASQGLQTFLASKT